MLKRRSFLALWAVLGLALPARAQGLARETSIGPAIPASMTARAEPLTSSSVARKFYEIASDLADSNDITGPQAKQAMVLLTAARSLDTDASYVQPLLIKLACRYADRDYSQQIYGWLANYTDEYADLEVVKEAIGYLLAQTDTREQREQILAQMLSDFGDKNAAVSSELATLLGLLKAEKGDLPAAELCFFQAYRKNKYNRLAFSKLAELVPERVSPSLYLEHLRLLLRENPLDIEAALAFAQYAERLQLYEVAAGAYEHSADLFRYLYPTEPLPARIYLPWAIASYNTQRSQQTCLQIAQTMRKDGRFDILLEAIAGRAAAKLGDAEESDRIFQAAEEKAKQLLQQGPSGSETPSEAADESYRRQVGAKQFAWFYCFARPDAARALDWANKAYSTDPNSPMAAALLAYALVTNRQMEWAKPLVESQERNQIANLAFAQIQLAGGQKESALEALESAIDRDPGSLAAERAKEILAEQGGRYTPPVDPDVVLAALGRDLGRTLVPKFVSPDKMISAQFNIRGREISYGSEFAGTVSIVNDSSEALVVSDDGLFRGNIRVDANVTGDLTRNIPNLISRRIRTAMLLEPGQGMLTSLRLDTGELKQMLHTYPQASLEIELTLYLDPVTDDEGKVANRLVDIKPVTVSASRPGVELTSPYLRNRYNSIPMSQPEQKVETAQLFIGLLKEQYAMAEQGALYRFKYADWMPALLKSALLQQSGLLLNPVQGEWTVRVYTMVEMLSLPLDHELLSAVAKNLTDPNWPVRMLAIYLLASSPDGGFARVLDWTAERDPSPLVRAMAIALTATGPPAPQPQAPSLQKPAELDAPPVG